MQPSGSFSHEQPPQAAMPSAYSPKTVDFRGHTIEVCGSDTFTDFIFGNLNKISDTPIGKNLIDDFYKEGRKLKFIEITNSNEPMAYVKDSAIYVHPEKLQSLRFIVKKRDRGKKTYTKEKGSQLSVIFFHEMVHLFYEKDPERAPKPIAGKDRTQGVKRKGFHTIEERRTIKGGKQKYGEKDYVYTEKAYRQALGLPERHLHTAYSQDLITAATAEGKEEQKLLLLIKIDAVNQIKNEHRAVINGIDEDAIVKALIKSDSSKMIDKLKVLRPDLFTNTHSITSQAIQEKAGLAFIHALAGHPDDYFWSSMLTEQDLLQAINEHDPFLAKEPRFLKEVSKKISIERQLQAAKETKNYRFMKTLIEHTTAYSDVTKIFTRSCFDTILNYPYTSETLKHGIITLAIDKAKKELNDQDLLDFIGLLVLMNQTHRIEELANDRSLTPDQIQIAIVKAINDPTSCLPRMDSELKNTFFPFLEKIGVDSSNPNFSDHARALCMAYELSSKPSFNLTDIEYIAENSLRGIFINFFKILVQQLPSFPVQGSIPEELCNLLLDANELNRGMLGEAVIDNIVEIIKVLKSKNLVVAPQLQAKLMGKIPSFIKDLDEDCVEPSVKPAKQKDLLDAIS